MKKLSNTETELKKSVAYKKKLNIELRKKNEKNVINYSQLRKLKISLVQKFHTTLLT